MMIQRKKNIVILVIFIILADDKKYSELGFLNNNFLPGSFQIVAGWWTPTGATHHERVSTVHNQPCQRQVGIF